MNRTMRRISSAALIPLFAVAAGAAGYEVATVPGDGIITGKVTFSGTDPAPVNYPVSKSTDVCGSSQEIDYVKVKDGALSDVVVYLTDVHSGKPLSDDHVSIDQKGCRFEPFVTVIVNRQDLTVHNSDAVAHNVHTYELVGNAKRSAFNVNQPDQGSVLTKTIKLRRGHSMKVECDQHKFMHAYVFVAKNPYYALVAEDGSYSIDGVPPGSYTLKAWHPTLGEQESSVDVTDSATMNFEFKAD